MGFRSLLSKPFAKIVANQNRRWIQDPVGAQRRIFNTLVQTATPTKFGADHSFSEITNPKEFRQAVPVRDYEKLKPYVERIKQGESDVLWPGKPLYFAKTSGTTSGAKYIPITRDSMPNHINSARNALLNYVHETGKSKFLDGKLIFLSGSPELTQTAGIHTGRLSGIVNHHVPGYLRSNQMPSFETNCIEDWEEKLERVIDETLQERMTLISGIPPWVQMYFDRIMERTGKHIKDVFPDFSLFVYGGVNFKPYRAKLFESIGKEIDSIETFPASEGFFAYQDRQGQEGLLLLVDSGIYYEFIPADKFFDENPPRIGVDEVELGVNYVMILNSNAGLWGYNLGDTVKFVSRDPFRVIVSGRIKHFISAFGEHVIGDEVEKALQAAIEKFPEVKVVEFTVAPNVTPSNGSAPHHQWLIEFANEPRDMKAFEETLDESLRSLNTYYDDLLAGNILKVLEVVSLPPASFIRYMKDQGKLGGQNKVPRLSNDRKIADVMEKYQ
jgi:hypothetical protein